MSQGICPSLQKNRANIGSVFSWSKFCYTEPCMRCPVCGEGDTKVVDSRMSADGASVRRRRECDQCGFRFSTHEEVEILDLSVIKTDGSKETYTRDKIVRGLKKALEKREYTEPQVQQLVQAIERDIQKKRRGQLTTAELGDIVMKNLRTFDKVAYIRFASVYRSFEDVESFEDELRTLIRKNRRKTTHSKTKKKKN